MTHLTCLIREPKTLWIESFAFKQETSRIEDLLEILHYMTKHSDQGNSVTIFTQGRYCCTNTTESNSHNTRKLHNL